jgi:hypothetical protein
MKWFALFAMLTMIFGLPAFSLANPNPLTVSQLTQTSAEVSWQPVSGALSYALWEQCIDGTYGFQWCKFTTVTGTSYNFVGLQPGTAVEVCVTSDSNGCPSLPGGPSTAFFITYQAASLSSSTTTLTSGSSSPTVGTSDAITITVVPAVASSTAILGTPTGSVTILVDGSSQGSPITLSGGIATYSFSSSTSGNHLIQATYSGDSTYAGSTGSIVLNVGGSSSSGSGTFTLSATNLSVAQGSSGTSTITLTPQNGYTGMVAWTISTNSTALATACYNSIPNTTVSGTAAVTASLAIDTNPSDCASAQYTGTTGIRKLVSAPNARPPNPFGAPAAAITFAALLCGGLFGRRSRVLRLLCALVFVTGLGLSLSRCGSTVTPTSSVPKGTYTIYISGSDTNASNVGATTSLTLTVD